MHGSLSQWELLPNTCIVQILRTLLLSRSEPRTTKCVPLSTIAACVGQKSYVVPFLFHVGALGHPALASKAVFEPLGRHELALELAPAKSVALLRAATAAAHATAP